MTTDDKLTVASVLAAVGFFSAVLVNQHWEQKIHKAPLQCRAELLSEPWLNDELAPEQPTSPGSGR